MAGTARAYLALELDYVGPSYPFSFLFHFEQGCLSAWRFLYTLSFSATKAV